MFGERSIGTTCQFIQWEPMKLYSCQKDPNKILLCGKGSSSSVKPL